MAIFKNNVMTGNNLCESPPSDEEQVEALYQELLNEEPIPGRTPKAELMSRLKEVLEHGEGRILSIEKNSQHRMITLGLYSREWDRSSVLTKTSREFTMLV